MSHYVGSNSPKQTLVGRFPNAHADRIRVNTLRTFILCTLAYDIIVFNVIVTACSRCRTGSFLGSSCRYLDHHEVSQDIL